MCKLWLIINSTPPWFVVTHPLAVEAASNCLLSVSPLLLFIGSFSHYSIIICSSSGCLQDSFSQWQVPALSKDVVRLRSGPIIGYFSFRNHCFAHLHLCVGSLSCRLSHHTFEASSTRGSKGAPQHYRFSAIFNGRCRCYLLYKQHSFAYI